MSEFAVAGGELKKLLALARRKPLSFAFNPGKGPEEHMFGADKRRAPEVVGRSIKKSGPGGKVAFGTCSIDAKMMSLVCEDPLPSMARKIKVFLKFHSTPFNVQILSPDGTLLDADVDEDDENSGEAAVVEEGPDSGAEEPSTNSAQENTPDADKPDPRELVARFKALQPQVEAVPEPQRAKLSGAMGQLAELLKTGKFGAAAGLLGKLEAALKGLKPVANKAAQEDVPDPQLEKLKQLHANLSDAVIALDPGSVRDKLQVALEKVARMLAAGDIGASAKGLKGIQGALESIKPPSVPDASLPEPEPVDLAGLRGQLKDLVGEIASAGAGNAALIKTLSGLAQQGNAALKDENAELAITHIAQLREALRPASDGMVLTLPIWRDAKDATNMQLSQLQSAMKNSGQPLFKRIADVGLNSITEHRLVAMQVSLMELDSAGGTDARAIAEQKLRAAMQDMRSFVDSNPVLPLLEANPLKVPLKIKATLRDALDKIDRAIAA